VSACEFPRSVVWEALDRPLPAELFTDAERAALRFTRAVLDEAEAFAHAIFRALDVGTDEQRIALTLCFPELVAAWTGLRSGVLLTRLRQALDGRAH